MRKIKINPVEPLEIEFADGTTRKALFNNEAFILFAEKFGNIDEYAKKADAENIPYELISKVLYCGLKIVHPNTTLEEAERITYAGGTDLILTVSELLISNFNVSTNDEVKKKFMEMLTPQQKIAVNEIMNR